MLPHAVLECLSRGVLTFDMSETEANQAVRVWVYDNCRLVLDDDGEWVAPQFATEGWSRIKGTATRVFFDDFRWATADDETLEPGTAVFLGSDCRPSHLLLEVTVTPGDLCRYYEEGMLTANEVINFAGKLLRTPSDDDTLTRLLPEEVQADFRAFLVHYRGGNPVVPIVGGTFPRSS